MSKFCSAISSCRRIVAAGLFYICFAAGVGAQEAGTETGLGGEAAPNHFLLVGVSRTQIEDAFAALDFVAPSHGMEPGSTACSERVNEQDGQRSIRLDRIDQKMLPAEFAIFPSDRVVALQGLPVKSVCGFMLALYQRLADGKPAEIAVDRGGQLVTLRYVAED